MTIAVDQRHEVRELIREACRAHLTSAVIMRLLFGNGPWNHIDIIYIYIDTSITFYNYTPTTGVYNRS